jgi:tRNA(Ile)-lysidine synthase TilS/MesJ
MDDIVRQIGLRNNCTYRGQCANLTLTDLTADVLCVWAVTKGTFCGVFRRQALDRGAVIMKADKIVTGHNADDIAETVLMNRTAFAE